MKPGMLLNSFPSLIKKPENSILFNLKKPQRKTESHVYDLMKQNRQPDLIHWHCSHLQKNVGGQS